MVFHTEVDLIIQGKKHILFNQYFFLFSSKNICKQSENKIHLRIYI